MQESELHSCALYCAFEHFGNTGENIKRLQGTRESPKISVIEINSCEVRPTSCSHTWQHQSSNCISCVFFGHSPVLRVWWGRPHYRWRGLWQWMRMWSGFAEAT